MMILAHGRVGLAARYGVPGSPKSADVPLPTALSPEARDVPEPRDRKKCVF
jgi:hypothetical protein